MEIEVYIPPDTQTGKDLQTLAVYARKISGADEEENEKIEKLAKALEELAERVFNR